MLLPARLATLTGAAAVTSAALDLGARFVHIKCTTALEKTVQRIDGLIGLTGFRHFDECKAARAAGVTVCYDADAIDGPVFCKKLTQRFFGSTEIQIANEYVLHGFS